MKILPKILKESKILPPGGNSNYILYDGDIDKGTLILGNFDYVLYKIINTDVILTPPLGHQIKTYQKYKDLLKNYNWAGYVSGDVEDYIHENAWCFLNEEFFGLRYFFQEDIIELNIHEEGYNVLFGSGFEYYHEIVENPSSDAALQLINEYVITKYPHNSPTIDYITYDFNNKIYNISDEILIYIQ